MPDIKLYHGDCLEELKKVGDKSVQLVLMDPPYGTVQNTTVTAWDSVIPFGPLWEQLWRVVKEDSAVVLFSCQPFTTRLIASDMEDFKYMWYWVKGESVEKGRAANFLNKRYQPGKIVEDICVFGKMATSYSPKGNMKYNPQLAEGKPYKVKGGKKGKASSSVRECLTTVDTENKGTRLPNNVLCFPKEPKSFHPTQKPVELLRYLIRTYTDEGDTVLDATMGSGSTGVAAVLEKRNFIGIERDDSYFSTAEKRISGALQEAGKPV